MGNSIEVLLKVKHGTIIGSSNPSSEDRPERTESKDMNRYLYTQVHAVSFTIVKRRKQPYMYVCVCVYYSTSKKKWNSGILYNMGDS